ncbi:hypothetical protein ACFE04_014816 [Oxalis oulophora]
MKPMIHRFKQEGSSTEKPSSLFSCFLAISSSLRLAPLLNREKNLVPDVFSILALRTASEAILRCSAACIVFFKVIKLQEGEACIETMQVIRDIVPGKLVSELNATAPMKMGDLDYDTIVAAYERINVEWNSS